MFQLSKWRTEAKFTELDIDHLSDLRLERIEESEIGSHFYYQQYFFEVPVVGADVAIHVNKQNQVIAVNSRFKPGLRATAQTIQPVEEAEKHASRFLSGQGAASGGKLMAVGSGGDLIFLRMISVWLK